MRRLQRTERACAGCADVDERGRPKLARWRTILNEYACEACWGYYRTNGRLPTSVVQEADPLETLQAMPGVEIVGPEP